MILPLTIVTMYISYNLIGLPSILAMFCLIATCPLQLLIVRKQIQFYRKTCKLVDSRVRYLEQVFRSMRVVKALGLEKLIRDKVENYSAFKNFGPAPKFGNF